MRSTYARAKARWCRWEEEIELLVEEMRRVVATFFWVEGKWLARTTARVEAREDIRSGLVSYAFRQASIYRGLAHRFGLKWVPQVADLGLKVEWDPRLVDHVQSVVGTHLVAKSGSSVIDNLAMLAQPSDSTSTSASLINSHVQALISSSSGTTLDSAPGLHATSSTSFMPLSSASAHTRTTLLDTQSRPIGTPIIPAPRRVQRSSQSSLLEAVNDLHLDDSDDSDEFSSATSTEEGMINDVGIPYGDFDSD